MAFTIIVHGLSVLQRAACEGCVVCSPLSIEQQERRMTKHEKTLVRTAMVVALLIWGSPWGLDSPYAAEPANAPPKDSSSQPEQTPEEAAGGKQNLQRMRKACDEDVKKLCPDIRPGGGRVLQCLRGQQSNLTPACRQVLGPRSSNP
jgi:hypothetical protein